MTLLSINIAIIVCWVTTGILTLKGMKEEHSHYIWSYIMLWIYALLITVMHLLQMITYVTRI